MGKRSPKRNNFFRICVALGLASLVYVLWLPDVRDLKTTIPSSTALSRVRGDSRLDLKFVPFPSIPRDLRKAIIIAEDAQFTGHNGIDFSELWESIKDALLDFSLPRGASTITQQLAKNLYLSESYNPLRKVKEYLVARRLERNLSKRRIFELYANLIEWGPHIYGVHAASEYYFKKSPTELTRDNAAFLAAIIPSPLGAFNPKRNAARVDGRKRLLLRRMDISSAAVDF